MDVKFVFDYKAIGAFFFGVGVVIAAVRIDPSDIKDVAVALCGRSDQLALAEYYED